MTGYILAINLVVAGLFAGAFAWLASYPRARAAARWIAAAYLLGSVNFMIEWLVPVFDRPRVVVFAAFATSLAGLALLAFGIARRYGRPLPVRAVAAILLSGYALNLVIFDMPRQSILRMGLYQAPYAAILALAAWQVFPAAERRRMDALLAWLIAASSAHFLSKPALASIFGSGATPQDYIHTIYGVISQSMGAMFMVGLGLMLFAVLVSDILSDATTKSETDPLTGLLNRRGFEARARLVGPLVGRTGIPASIVICDLDHFKSINDSFGHAAGDRVIAAFAVHLSAAMADDHVAGRIGGEEFAVILPGANAAAARLFAESIRTTFSEAGVEGLPSGVHPTASFGVAELRQGDTMSTMLKRADHALYRAKAEGRDCVRVASPDETGDVASRRMARGG
ncbi:sensor domain-containing diguanylate cyclase [Aquibium microcysteis]|uniref:GGDEF domain-containing protein n=1 Tax=Aquibium microcysteis TaxID=675281 RepID=UPI00165CFB46|nr:GGDEF domain-containing protein [Aquibium microcysteis]